MPNNVHDTTQVYYAVNDNGEIIQYGPFNLGNHWFRNSDNPYLDCSIFVHGLMFDSDWSPGTPHIILMKNNGEILNIHQTYNWSDSDTEMMTDGRGFQHLFGGEQ